MTRGEMEDALYKHHGQIRALARAFELDVLEVRAQLRKLGLEDWPARLRANKRERDAWRRIRLLTRFAHLEMRLRPVTAGEAHALSLLEHMEARVLARAALTPPDLRWPAGRQLAAAELAVRWQIGPAKALRMIEVGRTVPLTPP